jgi:hypothetical protein
MHYRGGRTIPSHNRPILQAQEARQKLAPGVSPGIRQHMRTSTVGATGSFRPATSPPTQIRTEKKSPENTASIFLVGKSGRQDRRRSEKYELTTENTNNPNTARPKIITSMGSPPNAQFQSKPIAIIQPLLSFNLTTPSSLVCLLRTTFLPSKSQPLHPSPRTPFPLPALLRRPSFQSHLPTVKNKNGTSGTVPSSSFLLSDRCYLFASD